MYLKSIDLFGFKSFVDKVHVDLEEGISCIVGPNGSGKSNISDAVRWVLGEQNARTLRGQKMEDIIFSGSNKRKPLGLAEVTLTLDNSDGTLPMEFNEISVTRRAYRNGDSEYLINGEQCRLKDISNLFVDTGIGNEGMSLIGQGRVNQIVDMKPEERRGLVEEAAGIVRYRNRKRQAVRKLNDTEVNLNRVSDIIGELETRVEPLRKQSEKAEKYLVLTKEADDFELNLMVQIIEESKKTIADLMKNIQEKSDEKIALSSKTSLLGAEIEETKGKVEALEEELKENQKAIYELKSQKDKDEANINLIENKEKTILENINRLKLEKENLLSKDGGFVEQVEALEKQKEELNLEISSLNEKLREEEKTLEEKRELLEEKGGELDLYKEESSYRTEDLLNLKKDFALSEQEYKNIELNIADIKDGQNRTKIEKEAEENKFNELNEKYKGIEGKLALANENTEKLNNDIDLIMKNVQKLAEEEVSVRYKLNGIQSRYNTLKDMEKAHEGYFPGVKAIADGIKEKKSSLAGIYGVFADLIEVPSKYRTAIEQGLGAALQYIVCEDNEAAKRGVSYLKEKHLGRATFIPLKDIEIKLNSKYNELHNFQGGIGTCDEIVEIDEKYHRAVEFLLGNIGLVETLDDATKFVKLKGNDLRVVTLEGDMITPGGAITGGSKSRGRGDLLARKGELQDLEKQVNELSIKSKELSEKLKIEREKEENATLEKDKIAKECRELELNKISWEKDLSYSRETVEKQKRRLLLFAQDLEEAEKELSHIKSQQKRIEESMANWDKENAAINSRLAEYEKVIGEITKDYEAIKTKMQEKQVALARLEQTLVAVDNDIARLKGEKEDIFSTKEEKEKEIAKLNEALSTLSKEKKLHNELMVKTVEDISKMEEKFSLVNSNVNTTKQKLAEREQEYSKESRSEMLLSQEINIAELKKTRAEADLDNEMAKLEESFEISYEEAFKHLNLEISRKDLAKKVKSLRNEIAGLGSINLESIEEYKEVSERYAFLTSQFNDLTEAKQSLNQIIADMDKIMTKRFKESFNLVSDGFNKTFSKLFGGGSAGLVMTDPENILETGVEIALNLPGKKVNNYNLLSGGEKALIGIALLLAVFQVRPSPFCILDEADAALDEANVDRFAEYLKEYASKTQFIVITHRQGTMEVASVLWGITMEEQGVSKMVSVKLDNALESIN